MKKEYVRCPWAPIAFDGWTILLNNLFGVVVSLYIYGRYQNYFTLSFIGLSIAFLIFSIWFFRDPKRSPAERSRGIVVSAADGTVLKVESVNDARYGGDCEKLSIFMSPLNVHVNRAPIQGIIEKVEYIPGKFFAANLDKASTDNERNWVTIRGPEGERIAFLQIAGFIARRIVCHIKVGDSLEQAQRYGMIRFGSRMEMFFPKGTVILAKVGDKLAAGNSVVARLF